ncbi:MAG: acyl-CoA thioester hydrolase [Actinomycetota bacterium]|nr:acyl-CoA thioester hydrolase [Actinomycetota bacterium]
MEESGAAKLGVTYKGVVYPRECDHMGHMNVASYVAKFDEATWQVFASCGITRDYMAREGAVMAGVHQALDYLRELRAGDVISVRSRIVEAGARKLRWVHEMYDDATNERVATCELTAVHLDATSRKAKPFPESIRHKALELSGDDS